MNRLAIQGIGLVTIFAFLASAGAAQQRLWERVGGGDCWHTADTFGDFNGDGAIDILSGLMLNYGTIGATGANRILSGVDGTTILQRSTSGMRDAGDMDGDGLRDYATVENGPSFGMQSLKLRSFAGDRVLWSIQGPYPYFAIAPGGDTSLMDGNLDLDGDGRPDFVALNQRPSDSTVYAYDNSGSLRYAIPVYQIGWVAVTLAAMPDLDGDGGDDFLVGCLDPSGRGAVLVISGNSGQIGRISYGLAAGDLIGGAVCNAGDVDQDGMADYAAASYWSASHNDIVIFSGRTGAVIRDLPDFGTDSGGMIGDIDVDLDGVPDLLVGVYAQVRPNVYGRVRAFSGRDGGVLWDYDSPAQNDPFWPWPMINLGVQPGSPYPAFAFRDNAYNRFNGIGRILGMSTRLPGAGPVSGTPCSSTGTLPQIGMRLRPGGSRITIAKGPPGAAAVLVGGPAGQTTYGSIALPYALDPLGLPGCSLLVAPVVQAPVVLGTTGIDRGYAAVDLPWSTLSPTGVPLAAQWVVLDASTGSYATTARHDFRVP